MQHIDEPTCQKWE